MQENVYGMSPVLLNSKQDETNIYSHALMYSTEEGTQMTDNAILVTTETGNRRDKIFLICTYCSNSYIKHKLLSELKNKL